MFVIGCAKIHIYLITAKHKLIYLAFIDERAKFKYLFYII